MKASLRIKVLGELAVLRKLYGQSPTAVASALFNLDAALTR